MQNLIFTIACKVESCILLSIVVKYCLTYPVIANQEISQHGNFFIASPTQGLYIMTICNGNIRGLQGLCNNWSLSYLRKENTG